MSNSVYKVTLCIHVIIYAAFSCFIFAADSSAEDQFDPSSFRAKIKNLKRNTYLSPSDKLKLACSYFWLGSVYHTAAILDIGVKIDDYIFPDKLESGHVFTREDLEDLHKEFPEQRAQASMYLGYTYLSIGNVSKALENFAAAFEVDPDLEYEKAALRHESSKEIIKTAKIAGQMKHLSLDLFVAVDVSKSVSKKQTENIKKLQQRIGEKLRKTDQVFFQPFGNTPYEFKFEFSAYSPSLSIVESLGTDLQTNFVQLFDELAAAIKKHETNETTKDSVKRKTAILIISDGEHSPEKNAPGQQDASVPSDVVAAIGRFPTNSDNIPIVMLIVDRMFQGEAVDGSDYANEWAQKLTEHKVGQSIYYGHGSELEVILKQIFDIIAPQRNRIVVQHTPKSGYQGFFLDDPEPYTVNLKIESALPNAHLQVKGPSLWSIENSSSFGSSIWQQYKLSEENEKNILPITNQGIIFESVEITPSPKFRKDLNNFYSQIFVLTFHQLSESNGGQTENPISKTPLLFHKTKPEVQIDKWRGSDNKVLLKSKGKSELEFQAKIKSLDSPFRQPIPLKITIPENNCFSMVGQGITEQVAIIPVDTASYSQWQKFKVPIETKNIDGSAFRQPKSNIAIRFKIDEGNKEHQIGNKAPETDVLEALKPDVLVVNKWIYYLYKTNAYIWILLLSAFIPAILYPLFAKIYQLTEITPDDFSTGHERFKVCGHAIYDSKNQLILRLQQWWWFVRVKREWKNPKSDIGKVTLLRLSSGKLRKPKEKEIDLLDRGDYISPTERYQIILQANGVSSKFNIDCNYTLKIWYKRIKLFLFWFGILTLFFMFGCACVFWFWYPRLTAWVLGIFIATIVVGAPVYIFMRNDQNNGLYKKNIGGTLGVIVNLFDGVVSLLEFFWQFIT